MNGAVRDILIVDDGRTVRASYRVLFEREGYSVRVARSGAEALRQYNAKRPDVVLLDVDMPDKNGYTVCREMRESSGADSPLIFFLTAMESDADQLRGLGVGADDYVFKTSSNEVLLARVAAALARRDKLRYASSAEPCVLDIGRFRADLRSFAVFVDGKPTGERLTKTEVDILRALVAADGRFMTMEALVEAMRGKNHVLEPSTIRSHMTHIRAKLGPAAPLLVNEREAGYRIVR